MFARPITIIKLLFIVALAAIPLVDCGYRPGEFFWAIAPADGGLLERRYSTPAAFTRAREGLELPAGELVFWRYRMPDYLIANPFAGIFEPDGEILASYARKNYKWLETGHKAVSPDADGLLHDSFRFREEGCYSLRLVRQSEIFDTVVFRILAKGRDLAYDENLDKGERDEILAAAGDRRVALDNCR